MNFRTPVQCVAAGRSKLARASRSFRSGRARRCASLFAIATGLVGLADAGHASILEFDQIREAGVVVPTISGRAVPQDYGDRVTSSPMNVPGGQFTYGNDGEGFTPNVEVEYFAGSAGPNNPAMSLWVGRYGDLTNVLLGNNNSLSLNVRLTADAGFVAQLYGFDLAGWPETDYTIDAVRVLGENGTWFEQNNVLVQGDSTGPGHTSFDFATPWIAAELLIQIDYDNLAGGLQDSIGIDNIRFGQNPPAAIPLPAAWLLLLSGLSALGFLRHVRRPASSPLL